MTRNMSNLTSNLSLVKLKMSLRSKDEIFLLLHCEKNADGTRNLILQGNDLQLRVKRRIRPLDVIKICYFLKKFDKITNLNLCYNHVGDQGLMNLVDNYFVEDNNLEGLNLNYCDITEEGIEYFCRNVKNFKVRNLRLSGNPIGTNGGQQLALFLENNEYVEYLDLGQTDQTLSSVPYFMKILNNSQGLNRTIKVLDLSRIIPSFNRYNYNSEHLADAVSVLLASNESLIELHLQKNQLHGHDIETICDGLKLNKTLIFLDLGYNQMGNYGIEVIGNYLKLKPPLQGLNVAGNQISDTGARGFSFGLPFSRIRLLDMSYNKMTPTGIEDILNSLKKVIKMQILNLWGNSFNNRTNTILNRMFKSGVLNQKYVDVKVYEVDEVLYAAYNPSDRYKHKYYCELDYACAVRLKIKKNNMVTKPHPRINFKFYPVIPGFEARKKKIIEHYDSYTSCACEY